MKLTTVALSLATAATLASAQPHHHHKHRHGHVKRVPEAHLQYARGPTVYYYELDGEKISEDKVCEGIANGSLRWADGTPPPSACGGKPDTEQEDPPLQDAQFFQKPAAQPNQMNVEQSSYEPEPQPTTSEQAQPTYTAPSNEPDVPEGEGVDREFPNGEISCSSFPSAYGAVPANWLGLGGWTGVQHITLANNMVSDIRTAIDGETCSDGSMCSYSCPPGYQKSQWPSTQGSTGQSVGGLECRGGKLYLTNPTLSKKLCIEGVGGVQVKNTLGQSVAVCRTDYPGTEAETVFLDMTPGSTKPLTCPNANEYYQWQGAPTTAQYYVNPAGVPVSDGCRWGSPDKPWGNYAPINLGSGMTDGIIWLSIMQNAPTTNAKLEFNIKIKGDLGGACKYENGMFHDLNGSNNKGCTVSVNSGEATYEFY